MARGFGTGLLHGAVVGVIALIGASMLFPPSDLLPPEARVQPEAAPILPEASPDADGADQPRIAIEPDSQRGEDAAGSPQAEQPPLAGILDTPAGSEFGRANDERPVAPAPLTPVLSPAGGTAPVVAPADEATPMPATAPADRPSTAIDSPAVPPNMTGDIAAPDLPVVPEDEGQGQISGADMAPGRAVPPPLDSRPKPPSYLPAPALQPDLSGLPDLAGLSSDPASSEMPDAPALQAAQGQPQDPQQAEVAADLPAQPAKVGRSREGRALPAPDLSLPPAAGAAGFP